MRPRPSTIGAFVVALCLLQGAVYAQDGDVAQLVGKLQSDRNQDVEEARDGLIALVKDGDILIARRIARELESAELLQSTSTLTRLNTILVAGALPQGAGADLLLIGLQDENDGVRYTAAKSFATLATQNSPAPADWDRITAAIIDRSASEQNDHIQRWLLQALIDINSPASRLGAADLLTRRAARHEADPTLPLNIEAETFKRLLRTLHVDMVQKGIKPPDDLLEKCAIAGLRYMQVAAAHLASGQLPEAARSQHATIFNFGQSVFQYVARQRWPGQTIPPEIKAEDWPRNHERVTEMVQQFTQPPFALPAEAFEVRRLN